MKNLFVILIAAAVISSCAFQQPYEIAQPPGPSNIVIAPATPPIVTQSDKPVVILPPSQGQATSPQVKIWRPEPNNILICNLSKSVTVDRLWIDSRPSTSSPPTIQDLGPEMCQPIVVFFGDHYLYAEGSTELSAYGKVSVGTTRKEFSVRNWSCWWGGYAQRLYIYDGDFRR